MENEKDDLNKGMDKWQVETTMSLMTDYGHSYSVAAGLAAMSRLELEVGLRKPVPLVIVTGI